jgi:lysophospholipase L1-like esterase
MLNAVKHSIDLVANLEQDNEGFPGFVVEQINNEAKPALLIYKPNVVLINAGTNDATLNNQVDTTGNRMRDMIMECFIRVPGTVVILSTLIPNTQTPENFASINNQYRNVAAQLRAQGFHIILAEMNDGFITIDDIWDGTHPYLLGFEKMASVWTRAINEAEKEGWLVKPSDDVTFEDTSQGTSCNKVLNSGANDPRSGMQILTAGSALIYDDGPYVHSSTALGVIFSDEDYRSGSFFLAQLVNLNNVDRGGERDDLIYVYEQSFPKETPKLTMFINQGDGTFGPPVDIDVQDSCEVDGWYISH